MELNGFFAIQTAYSAEARVALDGYSAHLAWIRGAPYLTDLGSTGKILVNGTPIEPNKAVAIRAGDRISIGNMHLTWNAGVRAGQPSTDLAVTASTGEAAKPDGLRMAEEPASPAEKGGELLTPKSPDAAQLFPKHVVEQLRDQSPDPTLVAQKRPAKPPVLETPPDKTEIPGKGIPIADDAATYKTAWVDMAQLYEQDKAEDTEFVSTTILRDTKLPHLVLHLPNRTWEVPFSKDPITIGRAEDSDISIAHESVSRHHALIERRGQDYVIHDAGSRNGIWLGQRRIGEHKLRDGDVVRLGQAKLVFKGGFTSDDLTLIGTPRIDGKPARRPVVFVPGLMGSELWSGSERLWPSVRTIVAHPEVLNLPGDPRIEARGILNDVVIVPNIIQLRQYSGLGDYLESGLGYTRGKDLLEFAYDWRHDVRLAAQRLAEKIELWQVNAPITIIAHSLGTLVARYYVERLEGKRYVERIILMGGPHYGTPGVIASILSGPGLLPFGMGDERLRDVLATFPSAYQILPIYPCIIDQNGNYIDVLKDESWLPEHQRPFLGAARSFRRELGTVSSIPTVSIFGYGLKTKLRLKVHRQSDGQWQNIEFVEDLAGDQSVPSGSAVLKDSEIHPVFQEHGSLFVDNDVRMRLKVELTRSTTWQRRK